MQESYISLDPERADSMSSQVRRRNWNDRVQESCGGQAGAMMANQCALTTMVCSYTVMRGRGFRVLPFGASKVPAVAGILAAGVIGGGMGSSYAQVALGDSVQYWHLMGRRSGVMAGTSSRLLFFLEYFVIYIMI